MRQHPAYRARLTLLSLEDHDSYQTVHLTRSMVARMTGGFHGGRHTPSQWILWAAKATKSKRSLEEQGIVLRLSYAGRLHRLHTNQERFNDLIGPYSGVPNWYSLLLLGLWKTVGRFSITRPLKARWIKRPWYVLRYLFYEVFDDWIT